MRIWHFSLFVVVCINALYAGAQGFDEHRDGDLFERHMQAFREGRLAPNDVAYKGLPLLHHALMSGGTLGHISELLNAGADPNGAADGDVFMRGVRPIMYAAEKCEPEKLRLLLNAGASPDDYIYDTDITNMALLDRPAHAILNGATHNPLPCLDLLVEYGADLGKDGGRYMGSPYFAFAVLNANDHMRTKLLDWLRKNGVDPRARNMRGEGVDAVHHELWRSGAVRRQINPPPVEQMFPEVFTDGSRVAPR